MGKKDAYFNFLLSKKAKEQLYRVMSQKSLEDHKQYSAADIIRQALESKFGIKNE